MADDFEADSESGGFLNRLRESPRTVSALIIILIIAAAIYAFSGNENTEQMAVEEENQVTTTDGQIVEIEDEDESEDEVETGENEEEAEEGKDKTVVEKERQEDMPKPVTSVELEEEVSELPAPTRTVEGFSETVEAGEGITHLARRATTRWLSENQTNYAVTNEHRIFIEDYIQNRVGSEGLSLGETRTISFDLITEAVEAAEDLDENQIRNLSQYTYALSS